MLQRHLSAASRNPKANTEELRKPSHEADSGSSRETAALKLAENSGSCSFERKGGQARGWASGRGGWWPRGSRIDRAGEQTRQILCINV